jgi:hypothetical protein
MSANLWNQPTNSRHSEINSYPFHHVAVVGGGSCEGLDEVRQQDSQVATQLSTICGGIFREQVSGERELAEWVNLGANAKATIAGASILGHIHLYP